MRYCSQGAPPNTLLREMKATAGRVVVIGCEEEEEANAQAQEELGSWDDGMGDLNSYAFIAYVYVRDRLFIVEINAQTLQGLMAGQGRGTQCLHAMCTHLPEGVAADDVDTVDLHVKKTNEPAIHLYNARKIMVEEREGDVVRGKMQTISGSGPRVYQVDDPPRGQKGDPLPKEATWEYRRRDFRELFEELSNHPKVVDPKPQPHWEYFTSRKQLETKSPHLFEIVKSMTERFHQGEGVRAPGGAYGVTAWAYSLGIQPGYTTSSLQPAACSMQHATCSLQPADYNLHPATCILQPAAYNLQTATSSLQPAACSLPPATWAYSLGIQPG